MIICITGLTGSGKTTFAKILIEKLHTRRYTVVHITSDMVRRALYQEELSKEGSIDRDFTDEELTRTYNCLYFLCEEILRNAKQTIIITDGTYRQYTQRLLLKSIARRLDTPFVLVKVSADDKKALERIEQRFLETGQNGPKEYYDIKKVYEEPMEEKLIPITNNGDLTLLEQEAAKVLEKLELTEYCFAM